MLLITRVNNTYSCVFIIFILQLFCSYQVKADDIHCKNGPVVAKSEYCGYFKKYQPIGTPPSDQRIIKALTPVNLKIAKPLTTDSTKIRSIAVIVGIDKYDNTEWNVPPAAKDIDLLQNILIGDQQFDEVIVLRNTNASKETIRYFLSAYIPKQLLLYEGGKTRVLFAYSGHGIEASKFSKARLVLSKAMNISDIENTFPLDELNGLLRSLAKTSFHLLALINACYGGDVFIGGGLPGGNPFVTEESGAYAITGPNDKLLWSLNKNNAGSIFFEKLIEGIKSGQADLKNYVLLTNERGETYKSPKGVIRLGALMAYLTEEIQELGPNPSTGESYPPPWIGTVSEDRSRGAFFFLAPKSILSAAQITPNIQPLVNAASNDLNKQQAFGVNFKVPTGAVSSIVGHPEIKVFNPPESYKIQGIDISQYNEVNWRELVKSNPEVTFVYIRATGILGVDKKFKDNWKEAKKYQMLRGAYHYFSYCQSVDNQFEKISRTVKIGEAELPIALALEWPAYNRLTSEVKCAQDLGSSGARDKVISLLKLLQNHYGKIPVVHGGTNIFNQLLTQYDTDYTIWLGDQTNPNVQVNLAGTKPWAMWQYNVSSNISGIKGSVDRNVFFGTWEQFNSFKSGNRDVAKEAATSHQ
jgi:lysozyme